MSVGMRCKEDLSLKGVEAIAQSQAHSRPKVGIATCFRKVFARGIPALL